MLAGGGDAGLARASFGEAHAVRHGAQGSRRQAGPGQEAVQVQALRGEHVLRHQRVSAVRVDGHQGCVLRGRVRPGEVGGPDRLPEQCTGQGVRPRGARPAGAPEQRQRGIQVEDPVALPRLLPGQDHRGRPLRYGRAT